MQTTPLRLSIALAAATSASPPALGQTLEERIERVEQENREQAAAIERQEETIAEQNQRLQGAPRRVERLDEALDAETPRWFERIEMGGLIEVEALYLEPFEGSDESDIVLATFEFGVASQINDWVRAEASLLFEEDETDLEVDVAFATIANPEVTPFYLNAGQYYLPFGAYETNLVSDPLTLEIGETRETAVEAGFVHRGFSGGIYAFNGDNDIDGDNEIGSWGANLAFAAESDTLSWSAGLGYINDLGDSDVLQDAVADNRSARLEELLAGEDADAGAFNTDPSERTGGWTANFAVVVRDWNLIGEYVSATEDFDRDSLAFDGSGARPEAWNVELGYTFALFGREQVLALAYQGTGEALALELPEERWLVGWSVALFDNTALSLEYAHDRDYDRGDGGTDERANGVVAQLAVEF